MSSTDLRVRISEYGPRLVQVVLAVIGFFAVTMLSDIRGEIREMSASLQDVLIDQVRSDTRLGNVEADAKANAVKLEKHDDQLDEIWRHLAPQVRR